MTIAATLGAPAGAPPARRFGQASRFGWPLLIVALAAAASWPAFGAAFPATHDGLAHLLRLHQFDLGLRAGELYPRLAPDAGFGLGAPIFQLYPPLAYYLGSALHAVGFGWIDSLQLLMLGALVGSGVAMYALGRQYLGRPASAVAALAYVLAPYHLAGAWIRGSLPELLAFAWLPLILLAIEHIAAGRRRWLWLLVVASAALLTTHLLTALVAAPLLLAWTALALWRHRPAPAARRIALLGGGATLALLISAAYLLPAGFDQGLVQLERATREAHPIGFVSAVALLPRGLLQAWTPADLDRFLFGALNAALLLLALAGVLAIVRRGLPADVRRLGAIALGATALGLLLADPATAPLWALAGGSSYVWLPFRFLTLVCLGMAVLAGLAIEQVSRVRWQASAALGAAGLLALSVLLPLRPVPSGLGDAFVNREGIAAAELVAGIAALTATAEYLPAAANPLLHRSTVMAAWFAGQPDPIAASPAAGGVTSAATQAWAPQARAYSLVSASAGEALLGDWYLPTWRAAVDGAAARLAPAPASGLASLSLPAGQSAVELTWLPTMAATAGGVLSLAGLAALVPLTVWAAAGLLRSGFAALAGPLLFTGVSLLVLGVAWLAWRDAYPLPAWSGEARWAEHGVIRLAGPAALSRFAPGDTVPISLDVALRNVPPGQALVLRLLADYQLWSEQRLVLDDGRLPGGTASVTLPAGFWSQPFAIEVLLDPPLNAAPAPLSVPFTPHDWPLRTMPLASTGASAPPGGRSLLPAWDLLVARLPGAQRAGSVADLDVQLAARSRWAPLPGSRVELVDAAGGRRLVHDQDADSAAAAGQQWLDGQRVQLPLRFALPPDLAPGGYRVDLMLAAADADAPSARVDLGELVVTANRS